MNNNVRKRRVALIGCRSVGKSSLTMRFTQNTFSDMYIPTIEDTMTKELSFRGERYRLEIADTAGQESGSPCSSAAMLNVDGWVFVFSTTNRKSFEYLRVIRQNLVENTGNRNLPTVLAGNKVDLNDERQVTEEEVQRLSTEWACPSVCASAKLNQNVNEIFEKCLFEIEKANGNISVEKKCSIS